MMSVMLRPGAAPCKFPPRRRCRSPRPAQDEDAGQSEDEALKKATDALLSALARFANEAETPSDTRPDPSPPCLPFRPAKPQGPAFSLNRGPKKIRRLERGSCSEISGSLIVTIEEACTAIQSLATGQQAEDSALGSPDDEAIVSDLVHLRGLFRVRCPRCATENITPRLLTYSRCYHCLFAWPTAEA